jgi:VanZ family protein
MNFSKPVWRVLALVVTIGFFLLAMRVDLYNATSPRELTPILFGSHAIQFSHPWWLSAHIWLRKFYSIVAFTIVGFTADRALGATARPALRAAIIVGFFSLGIEIAQRLFVADEPNLESALDVACGALGGWIAVFYARWIARTRSGAEISHALGATETRQTWDT